MSEQAFDFNNLNDQQKAMLMIKLDGFVEAAVQAARFQGTGVSEALSLATLALLREIVAHGMSAERAAETWRGRSGRHTPRPAAPSR